MLPLLYKLDELESNHQLTYACQYKITLFYKLESTCTLDFGEIFKLEITSILEKTSIFAKRQICIITCYLYCINWMS